MINMILCGGVGSRLWPISRKRLPKQFCKLVNGKSLLQHTVIRNSEFCSKTMIVTNRDQYFLALDQLEELEIYNSPFLLEPVGRNTAPAIALGCMDLDEDDIVLVTPSDHLIKDQKAYKKVIEKAKEFAENGNIVTFGIQPDYPETGYGYIQGSDYDVLAFKEKPNLETAKEYIEKGNYYWNSGMFMFKVSTFLEELKKYSHDIFECSKVAYDNANKDHYIRINEDDMLKIPANSIDYAVMEKSELIKVVPSSINWSDLGSFKSFYQELDKDEDKNVVLSDAGFVNVDSSNNFIYSESKKVATVDVDDMIIVDTKDALLVGKKESAQKVKDVVEILKDRGSKLIDYHVTEHRPWGHYTVVEEGYRYKMKTISVKSGAKLSSQKHFHRNEHWIVVNGTAVVTLNDKEIIVRANESTYIPMGTIHRLENPGKIDLVMIEVQVGDYLEEDDIVRYDDVYKRD